MTALDAALAFKQVHNVAVHVGEDLNFDVPGRSDEAFDEYGPVSEGIHRLGYRPFEAVFQFGIFTDDAHAFTTATSTGFDEQGVADAFSHLACLFRRVYRVVCARNQRHVKRLDGFFRGQFGPHGFNRMGARADETDVRLFHSRSEGGIFGEETVTGVDGVGSGAAGGVDDFLGHQVTF